MKMARRDDQQRQVQYTTVLPTKNSLSKRPPTNGHVSHQSPAPQRPTELERAKAVSFGFFFFFSLGKNRII